MSLEEALLDLTKEMKRNNALLEDMGASREQILAKATELAGGEPSSGSTPAKRTRRTKAEIEADKKADAEKKGDSEKSPKDGKVTVETLQDLLADWLDTRDEAKKEDWSEEEEGDVRDKRKKFLGACFDELGVKTLPELDADGREKLKMWAERKIAGKKVNFDYTADDYAQEDFKRDDDERPRRSRDRDEEERPRRSRDEEEERPRRSRDRDEDERPRRGRDEDEEERPRRSRDRDDDDRPRRSRDD